VPSASSEEGVGGTGVGAHDPPCGATSAAGSATGSDIVSDTGSTAVSASGSTSSSGADCSGETAPPPGAAAPGGEAGADSVSVPSASSEEGVGGTGVGAHDPPCGATSAAGSATGSDIVSDTSSTAVSASGSTSSSGADCSGAALITSIMTFTAPLPPAPERGNVPWKPFGRNNSLFSDTLPKSSSVLQVSESKMANSNVSPLTKSSTNSSFHSGFKLPLATRVWKLKSGFLGSRHTQYGSEFPAQSASRKPAAPTILTFSFASSSQTFDFLGCGVDSPRDQLCVVDGSCGGVTGRKLTVRSSGA